jgi:hypothetical protein
MYNPKSIEEVGFRAGEMIIDSAGTLLSEIDGLYRAFEKSFEKKIQTEAWTEHVSSFLSEIEKSRKIIQADDPVPGPKMHQLRTKVLNRIDEFIEHNQIAKILKIREETSKIVNGLIDQLNAEEKERRASAKHRDQD